MVPREQICGALVIGQRNHRNKPHFVPVFRMHLDKQISQPQTRLALGGHDIHNEHFAAIILAVVLLIVGISQ